MGPCLVGELTGQCLLEEDSGRSRNIAPPPLGACVSLVRSGEGACTKRDAKVKCSSFESDPVVHKMGLI
jgi:hypothetical protein